MEQTRQVPAVTAISGLKTGGYCKRCGKEHWLGPGNSISLCRELIQKLETPRSMDLFSFGPGPIATPDTTALFGPARGKMFGVMECQKADGTPVTLYAFSGQYNGFWQLEGWVPPLFEPEGFFAVTQDKEQQIKNLGRVIEQYTPHSSEWLAAKKKRRLLSRELMCEIHGLYRLSNFRGQTVSLAEAFCGGGGIPTGTGDCCAPKLLNFAAKNDLYPLGIAEFFWGKENRSKGHSHGSFSSSCLGKCRPILGFMLCGLDDRWQKF